MYNIFVYTIINFNCKQNEDTYLKILSYGILLFILAMGIYIVYMKVNTLV